MDSFYLLCCGSVRGEYMITSLSHNSFFSCFMAYVFFFIFSPPWFHCIAAQCVPSPPASPTSLVPPPSADYSDSSHIMKVWRWVPPTAQQSPPLPFTSSSSHKLSSWSYSLLSLLSFTFSRARKKCWILGHLHHPVLVEKYFRFSKRNSILDLD